MRFARADDGSRVEPTPSGKARCPQCGDEVLARCGTLVAWHWAHRRRDCDGWAEGETEWHRAWKQQVHDEATEVVLGDHRADIRTQEGVVIELQHSPLDARRIAEREAFYDRLVWLFDARSFALRFYPRGAQVDFAWTRPKKSLFSVRKPLYWDLGHGFVLHVESLHRDALVGGARGRGILLDAACFASSLFGAVAHADVHATARRRARRVLDCVLRAQSILRTEPQLGMDEAFRTAILESRASL